MLNYIPEEQLKNKIKVHVNLGRLYLDDIDSYSKITTIVGDWVKKLPEDISSTILTTDVKAYVDEEYDHEGADQEK